MGTDTAFGLRLYTWGLVPNLCSDTCKTPLANCNAQTIYFYPLLLNYEGLRFFKKYFSEENAVFLIL